MPKIMKRPPWWIPHLQPTDESILLNRRQFLAASGIAGTSIAAGLTLYGCSPALDAASDAAQTATRPAESGLYPAKRNQRYTLDRKLTRRRAVMQYVNYYEFDASDKSRAVRLAQDLIVHPWTVTVSGLVKKPKTFDVDDLIKRFPLEERLYRHRCVETWAMALPWIGFPFHRLLDLVEPLSSAKFVRFISFMRPEQAPGQRIGTAYPWPYHEGLRLDEARHELTLLATGMYGRSLSKQNGAPVRLVVPWKYGYKSIKAIVEIQLTDKQPPTFWNTTTPNEYGFYSNVDPAKPHPRWSQAKEWMIDGDQAKKRDTLPFNGYSSLVAKMYT